MSSSSNQGVFWYVILSLDNINELEPKERIELLIKLLPYVIPKVQTVSARDGEPIGLDWMNEF